MKIKYFFLLLLVAGLTANAQEVFITTWTVTSPHLTVSFGVGGTEANFDVDYGDGTIATNQGALSHTYGAPGTYTVTITGTFSLLDFSDKSNFTINQWGNNALSSVNNMFNNANNFAILATDAPNLSQITSTKNMFSHATSLDSSLININHWDVSTITNMESMFLYSHINSPINNWDVSNVTNMKSMFSNNPGFNQPLNNWDVSNVTDMSYMFADCVAINQPLDSWDVSNVTNMESMFYGSIYFNQSLGNWDVSNVTNMEDMFLDCDDFDQPLNNWDVSNVTNMGDMFASCTSFNQPLNNWDVSSVINMSSMFQNCSSFNQPLDNWDVSNVTNMGSMFFYANSFNQDISSWDFNNDITFYSFVGNSGLDTYNYDSLLLRFVQLGLENKTFSGANLEYCDAGIRNYLIEELGWSIVNDTQSETCDGNTVLGTITYDVDNNGCGTGDLPAPNILIRGNDDIYNYYAVSGTTGTYDLKVVENTYSIAPQNLPNHFTATPANSSVTFTGVNNTDTVDFCITATQQAEDLNITLLPLDVARPGEDTQYKLVVNNMGTQTVASATVTFNYDSAIQSYIDASETPVANTTGQLTFTISNLPPFGTYEIAITLNTFIPPTVNGGEIIAFTTSITPNTNDATPNDNTFTYNQEVVNSYDPNDKLVLQGESIYIEQAGDYLDYIVRFQNTGTASALKVVIKDELNPMLDWTTFQPVSASHNYQMLLNAEGQLTFTFNNINLPHEAADEAGSNGYIAYKIKPIPGTQIGDIINGEQAQILFDYNLPIITNTTVTEVIELLSTPQFTNTTVKLYPNPAEDYLNIETPNGTPLQSIIIYNLQGRELLSVQQTNQQIDISSLNAGMYLVTVKTSDGINSYKLIKK